MRLVIRRKRYWSEEDKDRAFSRFICVYFVLDNLNSVVQDVFGITGTALTTIKVLLAGTIFFFLLRPMFHFTKREWNTLFFAEILGSLAYIYSLFVGVDGKTLLGWAATTLGVCIPICVAVYLIRDKKILYKMMVNHSFLIFALLVLDMTANITNKRYDLHFSYALLLVILLHLNELINGKSKLYLLTIVSGCVMLVLFGSRGTFLCIGLFLIMKVFTNIESITRRIVYTLLLVAVFAGIWWVSNNEIIVYNFFASMGFKSRTLRLIAEGSFLSHDSGRSELWAAVNKAIRARTLLGWGVRGAVDLMDGHPYPHQFFLDLWLSFGVPVGTIVMILLTVPVRRVLTEPKGARKDMMQIFFCVGFFPLMYSNTLFICQYYFVLLGLVFSGKKMWARRKYHELEEDN
ncbi:MAG: hypothetical protein J6Y58_03090 [Clostridiales bacterium]|nr:hypothetical protein [Clostridiales bacterium]